MNKADNTINRRILVIDDNPSIHEDFRKILSPVGLTNPATEEIKRALFGEIKNTVEQAQFEVDSAYQGQEGAALVQKARNENRPYAMAFVDVRMPPGWDGIETTQKLWEIVPDLQIVICTAYSDYSWSEMFEKLGKRDGLLILKKPFDNAEALQLAHALTEKWRLLQNFRQKTEELERRVTERTSELLSKTAFLEANVRSSLDGTLVVDQNMKTILQNQRFLELFKMPAEIANEVSDERRLQWVIGMVKNPEQFIEKVRHLYAHPSQISRDDVELKDGTILDRYSFPAIGEDGKYHGRVWSFRDITERKRFEAQLFQSQKMETVGKLAGGVAHEFNSILTAIICQSELILGEIAAESSVAESVQGIHQSANRAAKLTQQLLAYGRKQLLQPQRLDLNSVLSDMEGTLKHIMGRQVEVRIIPGPGLKPVKMDPGQMQQVIINIAMNAAAAMPGGGQFIVETSNANLDETYASQFSDVKPGVYVQLSMTDSGTGISPEVKKHLFEPFQTVKGVGEGSGLGLATCYGIIKQSGGHINAYSEPSRGATFKIYLPQVEPPKKISTVQSTPSKLPQGTETILLAEDDPALREIASTLLTRLGYKVLKAANGVEALNLKHGHGVGHVDLVFTDVVMPHMSGKELSDRFRVLYPHTKVLFTSAYAENAVVHQGMLAPGTALLPKPFTPNALACKVREVLDQSG